MKNKALKSIVLDAPAKVNLCLSVKYPPVGGYHQLDSVFYELSLADVMRFEVRGIDDCVDAGSVACTQAGTAVALDCGCVDIPVEDNLVFKAIDAMERAFEREVVEPDEAVSIFVEKHIPAGGGLGGGSSDAAAAIKASCELMGIEPRSALVLDVARSLGADVAFFLCGGTALMNGRGDTLERKLPQFPLPVVLMGERQGMSTPRIYRDFDESPQDEPDARALASALDAFPAWGASYEQKLELAGLCSNNLEPAAFAALPSLQARVARAKKDPDVLNALVTGSGATSFAICADEGAAMRFEQRAAFYCDWTCLC